MSERTAYPLCWPMARPRARYRETNNMFKTSFADARDECYREIARLGGTDVIVSTNIPLRRDLKPQAMKWGETLADPGVAVYFKRKGKELCFACDKWRHVQDNMQALTRTIEALRGIARWGTGDMMEAAFSGFAALPAPGQSSGINPWQILGLDPERGASEVEIMAAFRSLSKKHHPDIPGGNAQKWSEIREAHDLLMATVKSK